MEKRRSVLCYAIVLLLSLTCAACGDNSNPKNDAGTTLPDAGDDAGTTLPDAGGDSCPTIEGWHPSLGVPPHFFLQPDTSFHVHPTHPRLYFRSDDLDWIRARAAGPLSDHWSTLEWMASSASDLDPGSSTATDSVGNWVGQKCETVALLALLEGNATYRDWAVQWGQALAALPIPGEDGELRARIERLAVVYDWLHGSMSEEERAPIRTGLIALVETLRDWSYMQDPAYLGGHERYGYATFAMGLIALHGDYSEADALLDRCRQHIAEGFYPAQQWASGDGGYHMGWAYSSSYLNFDLPYLVWTVGTNDILMDDWMGESAYLYLYGLQGDGTFPPAADAFSVIPDLGAKSMIYAAGPTSNRHALWFLREQVEVPTIEPMLQLLLLNDELAPESPAPLPQGRLFQPTGLVIARDGWDERTTHFTFKSGSYYSRNHHHRDENSFTIHYKAPLALDSGYYDSYGSVHWSNYFTRTIAHNGIVVFDPAQEMTLYGGPISNDGGQLFRGEVDTLEDILPTGWASLDGILRFEHRDDFTYALGDATLAYDPTRVTLAQRDVVYLRPSDRDHPVIVIFDRVGASSTSFEKRFLLHSVLEPTITGKIAVSHFGGARLTSVTAYPLDAQLRLIGGDGNEFTVEGANYPIESGGGLEGPPENKGIVPGAWRLEVSPGESHDIDFFLHVLFVDDDSASPVEMSDLTSVIATEAVGAEVAGWTLVFPRASSEVSALTYEVTVGGASRHLVTGLPPNLSMTFEAGSDTGQIQTGPGGCAVFNISLAPGTTVSIH